MFPGLVYEWETPEDLIEIANRNEYLHPTEAYKEMTYTDEAYGQYVNNLIKLQSWEHYYVPSAGLNNWNGIQWLKEI